MSKAVSGMKSRKFSVQGASNKFCVPRRTLRRHLEDDGPLKKSKLGGKPTLTSEQQKQLCQRILHLSAVRNLFHSKKAQASKPKKGPTTKHPFTNKPKTKLQQPSKKKTQRTTEAESCYCSVCQEDKVKDMQLWVVCANFYHEECVGLTASVKDVFICPNCGRGTPPSGDANMALGSILRGVEVSSQGLNLYLHSRVARPSLDCRSPNLMPGTIQHCNR
uniref:Zinc finger PHD-type domain-containing protein n=1 Tax=Timema cristinae TaxID=61476 RepID=A0A7R9H2P6_TIMCR|nr:unnamed protein product [Timema cristinae]